MPYILKTDMVLWFKFILIMLLSVILFTNVSVYAGSKNDVTILNLKKSEPVSPNDKGGPSSKNKKRNESKSSRGKGGISSENNDNTISKGEEIKGLEAELYEELYDIFNLISSIRAEIRIILQEKTIDSENVISLQKEICSLETEMSMKRLYFLLKARMIDPDNYIGRDPYKSLKSGGDQLSPN